MDSCNDKPEVSGIFEASNTDASDAAVATKAVATSPAASTPRRRWVRRIAIALGAVCIAVAVAAAAFVVYASDYYHDLDAEHGDLISTAQLPVAQGDRFLAFGDPHASVGFVFYPGAKVEYSSYAPLMRDLAANGCFTAVVEMPFNFAFFDIDAADRVRAAYPDISSWWLGGHSLGGSMAAQYAASHTADLAGLVLLGSYTASDLSASNLDILCIYGANDTVLNRDKLEESNALMPPDAHITAIAGGNHAQFGNYGPQEGDGGATISPAEQQAQTAALIRSAMAEKDSETP